MVDISADTWNKAGVSVIRIHENNNVNTSIISLHFRISKRWSGTNIYDLIDKEIKGKYKMNELTKQQIR